MPEISVILPTCDRPQLVGRALASILAQTFSDFEILLLDCNRRSPPVVQNPHIAHLLADPRVRILDARHTANAAASRNVGLSAATSPWTAFLDDDDEYFPDKLEAQLQLARASRTDFVLCGYQFVWPWRRRTRQIQQAWFRDDEIVDRASLITSLLFHRHDDTLRFDETVRAGHDVHYALRYLIRRGIRAIPCVQRAMVASHPQADSVHADAEAAWLGWKAAFRVARPHFSRRACRAFFVRGFLERASSGHGSFAHFGRCAIAVLRSGGLREWRRVVYATLVRSGFR